MTIQTQNARRAAADREALAEIERREELRRIAHVLAPLLVAIADERWSDAATMLDRLPLAHGRAGRERVELRRVLIDRFGVTKYYEVLSRLQAQGVADDAARMKARARQIANAQITSGAR